MKNSRLFPRGSSQLLFALLIVFALILASAGLPLLAARAQATNLALNKPVTCSSTQSAGTACANAVDGSTTTRWSSAFSDPQWIQVDLGAAYNLTSVVLRWEAAYGKAFQIQVSNDAVTWISVYTTTTGTGGVQTLAFNGTGRYVRMYGTVRATQYGYSLWEFEIYGSNGPTNTPSSIPGANFVGSPLSGSAPLAVQFTYIDSSPLTSCTWTFGDGASQAYDLGQNFGPCPSTTHTYTVAGSYTVSLSVIKYTGQGNSMTKPDYIQVSNPVTLTSTPTPPSGATNLALNKPVTFSSQQAGNEASHAVDGDTATRWAASPWPQWIQVDLGTTYNISKTEIMPYASRAYQYRVEVSLDGTSYATVVDQTANTTSAATLTDTFATAAARYVRLTVTGASGYTGGWASVYEFRVFSSAGTPPATNTPTPTATWTNTSPVLTNTPTPTATWTNTSPPPTNTPTLTATWTNTLTNTPTPSATWTNTPTITATSTSGTGCSSTNMAINRPATASSVTGTNTAALAADGFSGTRWESAQGVDPQWIQLDFGSTATFCSVVLHWEVAAAKSFQIQTSPDAATWTPIYSTTTGTGGDQILTVSGSGRYLRMYGTLRTTTYGYSLWEFEAYGSGGTVLPTITPIPTIQSGPVDFGPNVVIFDPSMSSATIQNRLDLVFDVQETNQFGTQRNALLFKPGAYSVNANIGFNTQISGLGFSPDDVTINGLVTADAQWFGGNATQNFWRIAENMKVVPTGGKDIWAVSQAAPFRRMHIAGALQLDPSSHGWSSGGFLADTKVDGQVSSGSQQQYISRNDQFGSWTGSNWNMVFVGVSGGPAQTFPSPAYTVVGQAPSIREKPFLYIDTGGNYFVFVPALRSNASGTSWFGQTPAGTSLPISQFFIVKPGASATDINNALVAGKDLLITPGVYHLDQTINITRANTVVLGMGLATLINDNGVVAMKIADVDGVKVAGILFDAGTTNASTLLEVGPAGSSAGHASNPTELSDVFARIGGAVAGKATVAVTINSSNVIVDHTWLWRADHGSGIGWTVNTADNGLVVNGNDVTIYGLFVEHFQKYNVLWNGNGGRTYFFQNELPYDPPNQAAYMNGTTRGYAAYKVADTVTTHEAWGVGSYCYFNVDPTIIADRGFEVPNTPNVKFHDLLTISLGNKGSIINVINTTGAITPTNSTTSTVVNYP